MVVFSHLASEVTVFRAVLKWVECIPVALFTHSVKKIKSTSDKTATSTLSVNRPLEVIV